MSATAGCIVCPVSFTDACRGALRQAAARARRHGSELHVLHVYVPAPPQPELAAAYLPRFEDIRAKLLQELRAFAADVLRDLPFSLAMASGDPAAEIVQFAARVEARLIVIGAHRRRTLERWLLGSTAEQVLRKAACPVLTACHPPGEPYAHLECARVLCALDLQPSSAGTLRAAAAWAAEHAAELTLVHVVEGPSDETLGVLGHLDVPEYRRQLEAEARRLLHEAARCAPGEGTRIEELVASGRAYKQILKAAAERSTDLIVMGVHSKGPADRLLFGSTAQQVVRAADCPVLTLR